jgi:UDP-N-acetylglucosamine--N-acetylmuramyl-(pentapeptide) pyrophosphoryl-undecaprenol N-acetylglucosamine transferase
VTGRPGASPGSATLGRIVIAGGGTAGHTLPAVAVGRALVARGYRDIVFVGSRRGLEGRLVREAGFPIVLLPGRGVARRLTWDNVGAVAGLGIAAATALVLLARHRPAVVLSVGGYAGAPCALASVVLRIPLVLAESNGVAGASNRLVGRWAKASAVAFPGTGLAREVVTGNPVRPEILAARRDELGRDGAKRAARHSLGLPVDRHVVAVTGGSLGARRINEATLRLAHLWVDRRDVAIHHVVGSRDWADVSSRPPPAGALYYQAVEYEERMEDVLVSADLVVSRAGGTTLAELTVLGVPAVLIPLPGAPDDHQSVGARQLEQAGAAVVVGDAELTAERLAAEVGRLLADGERLCGMAAASARLGRPDAADRVVDLLERYARGA